MDRHGCCEDSRLYVIGENMLTLSNRRFYASVVVCALLHSVAGLTLSPCDADDRVEVVETRGDNAVTCSGIPSDFIVTWLVLQPGRSQSVGVGTCNPGVSVCTSFSAIGFQATRPSADTSVMTINPRVRVEYVRNTTLRCQATRMGKHDQLTECRLDIVSPPSNVTCTVQPVTSASPWTVAGRCEVTKVYSYHGRYSCQWNSTQGESAETAVNKSVTMQTTLTTDVTPTNGTYVNGYCDVTMQWPYVDTSYRVVVSPGGESQDAGKIDNPCIPNPCQNNGSCVLLATDPAGFMCNCTPGFVNSKCNEVLGTATTPANTGLIVGGVVGGVALLTMGAVVFVLMRNKPMLTNAANSQATHHTAGQASSAVQSSHTMTASSNSKSMLSEKDKDTSGDS